MTQWSPSSLACVRRFLASDPAPGSVREKPASILPDTRGGRYFFFSSGFANMRIPSAHVPCIASESAVLAHAFPHISIASRCSLRKKTIDCALTAEPSLEPLILLSDLG